MKSIRLTKDLKYEIKKTALRQINKEFSQTLKELSIEINRLYKEKLPKEIVEFDNKYNGLIKWSNYFPLRQFESLICEDRIFDRDYCSLTELKFLDSIFLLDNLIKEEKDSLLPYYVKLKQLRLGKVKIDKDLSYLLSNVNTSLQLQKASPSVYKMLEDMLDTEKIEIEKCEKSLKEIGKEVEQQLNLLK